MNTNANLRFPTDAELAAEIVAPATDEYSSEVSVIMNTACASDAEND